MIPEGWKTFAFSEATILASGQVDPCVQPYSGMLHIGPENIESGRATISDVKTAQEVGVMSGKYEFDELALVYSKIRPNLNKVCWPKFKGICSADMYPIWPLNGLVDTEYLLQFMLSDLFVKPAVACSMRTGLPKINREDLAEIDVLLPPITEQRRISVILSEWDQASSTIESLIIAKQKRKKALMQQLLTGKKRLPRFKKPWRSGQLGDFLSERTESGRSDLPLLSITRDEGIIPRGDVDRKDTSSEDKSKYLRICSGDIGYNTMRMWQGVSALSTLEGIISPAYTVCVPERDVSARYMAHLFKCSPMIHLFERHSQGMTSDTWSLKYPNFAEIKATVPGFDEMEKIADVFDLVNKEIYFLSKKKAALQSQKAGLMNVLLTGKKRIKA